MMKFISRMHFSSVRSLIALATALSVSTGIYAQSTLSQNQDGFSGEQMDGFMDSGPDKDSTVVERSVSTEYWQWTIDPYSGLPTEIQPDTLHHSFHSVHLTEGMWSSYSSLGNMGSPRLSRLFSERGYLNDFMFDSPYDSWIKKPMDFRFTDTKTPHMNVDYYKGGDKRTGEEHIKGYFAANFNKRFGIGFDMDYLVGRGRYSNESTSFFDARVYAYYRGDRYSMHLSGNSDNMKIAENGGIQDPRYITNPEAMAEGRKSYSPEDIPFRLYENWNNITHKQILFNQSVPINRVRATVREVSVPATPKPENIPAQDSINVQPDSVSSDSITVFGAVLADAVTFSSATEDSISADSTETIPLVSDLMMTDSIFKTEEIIAENEIITVTDHDTVNIGRLAHSAEVGKLGRRYISYAQPDGFYPEQYLYDDSIDLFSNFYVTNTLSVSLLEGSTKWAIAGLTGFLRHEYKSFEMPDAKEEDDYLEYTHRYNVQDLTAGAVLEKAKGDNLTFKGLAEATIAGAHFGDLDIHGQVRLADSLFHDIASLSVSADLSSLHPAFFMEKYHSTFAWWDCSFKNEIRTHLGASAHLAKTGTTLDIDLSNIDGYIYLDNTGGAHTNSDGVTQPEYLIGAYQKDKSIQVLSASLDQKLKLGPLHIDSRIAWQHSSDERILPLPELNVFADMYLKFIYAKRLNMEIGANATYFTRYDAPGYCPAVGMYHLQNPDCLQQVGGYPLLTGYVNCSLRGVRFYVMYYHFNDGLMNLRDSFIVPGYPANPGTFKFGLSWVFYD